MDLKLLKKSAIDISILYVEDEDEIRNSVVKYLQKIFLYVTSAADGQEGLKLYQENKFDIVLTDINMPYMNGLEMAKNIKDIKPSQEIIIISAYSDSTYFLDAIRLGINGYIIKPIDYAQMNQALYKSIFNINNYKENIEYKKSLEKKVRQRTQETLSLQNEKIENFEKTLTSFVTIIEGRDTYTGGHSQRVANYCRMLARDMNCSEEDCDLIYKAGILHDIGKITTPDSILLKPGKLNNLEYKIIQQHVIESYEILLQIPMYKEMAEIIICHHEHYDGSGYPKGLKQGEIPFLARIMIVADTFDAMTTNRIYKSRKDVKTAVEELQSLSGKHFHPEVIASAKNIFLKIKDIEEVHQSPRTEIEQERFSYFYRDQLTSAYNSNYLDYILSRNVFEKNHICVHILYLHGFNRYNEKYGWSKGDELLNEVVNCLSEHFPSSYIFRIHGDDFVIMNEKHLETKLDELKCLNKLQNDDITSSNIHIDLRNQDVSNFKELEVLISPESST